MGSDLNAAQWTGTRVVKCVKHSSSNTRCLLSKNNYVVTRWYFFLSSKLLACECPQHMNQWNITCVYDNQASDTCGPMDLQDFSRTFNQTSMSKHFVNSFKILVLFQVFHDIRTLDQDCAHRGDVDPTWGHRPDPLGWLEWTEMALSYVRHRRPLVRKEVLQSCAAWSFKPPTWWRTQNHRTTPRWCTAGGSEPLQGHQRKRKHKMFNS